MHSERNNHTSAPGMLMDWSARALPIKRSGASSTVLARRANTMLARAKGALNTTPSARGAWGAWAFFWWMQRSTVTQFQAHRPLSNKEVATMRQTDCSGPSQAPCTSAARASTVMNTRSAGVCPASSCSPRACSASAPTISMLPMAYTGTPGQWLLLR